MTKNPDKNEQSHVIKPGLMQDGQTFDDLLKSLGISGDGTNSRQNNLKIVPKVEEKRTPRSKPVIAQEKTAINSLKTPDDENEDDFEPVETKIQDRVRIYQQLLTLPLLQAVDLLAQQDPRPGSQEQSTQYKFTLGLLILELRLSRSLGIEAKKVSEKGDAFKTFSFILLQHILKIIDSLKDDSLAVVGETLDNILVLVEAFDQDRTYISSITTKKQRDKIFL